MSTSEPRRNLLAEREVRRLVDALRRHVSDPMVAPNLTPVQRAHWQGAIVALETVLGEPPSLIDGEAAANIARLL